MRFVSFHLVVGILFLYTALKAGLLWPEHRGLAWGLTVPFFALMVAWLFLYRRRPHLIDALWFRALVWVGSLTMGLWATFILLTLPLDVVGIFAALFGKSAGIPFDRILLAGLGLSAVFTLIGFFQMRGGPRVVEILVPIADLPQALQDFRIAQISDLHVGPTIRREYVEEVVRRVNGARPDVIAVTGDLVEAPPNAIDSSMAPFADLKSTFGTYFVTGNHEYYWGASEWLKKLETLGMKPLNNENHTLTVDGAHVLVAGVTDFGGDIGKAATSTGTFGFKLLLAHRPGKFAEAEKKGFDLQLSGHTHAGQFFPWSLLVRLAHTFYRGLNRHRKMWLYVNSGTGYWGPANRFGIPSEISVLRLTRAA